MKDSSVVEPPAPEPSLEPKPPDSDPARAVILRPGQGIVKGRAGAGASPRWARSARTTPWSWTVAMRRRRPPQPQSSGECPVHQRRPAQERCAASFSRSSRGRRANASCRRARRLSASRGRARRRVGGADPWRDRDGPRSQGGPAGAVRVSHEVAARAVVGRDGPLAIRALHRRGRIAGSPSRFSARGGARW